MVGEASLVQGRMKLDNYKRPDGKKVTARHLFL